MTSPKIKYGNEGTDSHRVQFEKNQKENDWKRPDNIVVNSKNENYDIYQKVSLSVVMLVALMIEMMVAMRAELTTVALWARGWITIFIREESI